MHTLQRDEQRDEDVSGTTEPRSRLTTSAPVDSLLLASLQQRASERTNEPMSERASERAPRAKTHFTLTSTLPTSHLRRRLVRLLSYLAAPGSPRCRLASLLCSLAGILAFPASRRTSERAARLEDSAGMNYVEPMEEYSPSSSGWRGLLRAFGPLLREQSLSIPVFQVRAWLSPAKAADQNNRLLLCPRI